MNERLREALRRKIAAHNRLVIISSVSSVLGVIVMWAGFYFITRWAAVFSSTVVKGVEATMPERFDRAFVVIAVALLAVGWIARRAGFHQHLREEKGIGTLLIEIALLPARATFGTLQNLQNHIRFSEDELIAATDLLVRIVRAGRIAETAMPIEIPDEASRDRVLHALQLLDLIYLRRSDTEACYSVADPQRLLRFL